VSSQGLGITNSIINYSEADIIRAEMKYALNPVGFLMTMDANDYQMLARTGIAGEGMQYFYGTAYGVKEGVSGEWTRNYYGNNIVFLAESMPQSLMGPISEPVVIDPNYDYGYYAVFYPIYAEEKPNTTPVQMCPVEIKSGSYYESRVHTAWTYIGEEEPERYIFFRENSVKTFIDTEFDRLSGQTIDLREVGKIGTMELI
jgi:hypothetical protein